MTTSLQGRLAVLAGLLLLSLLVLTVGAQAAQAAQAAAVTGTGAGGGSMITGASGMLSAAAWIIAGSALAVLILGLAAWALVSRRRRRDEPLSVAFCARHPEHAMCGTT